MLASGQITINNIIDTLTCVIHCDDSQVLANKEDGLTLTCRLFNGEGEIDSLDEEISSGEVIGQYYYVWKRNGEDWREISEIEENFSSSSEEDIGILVTTTGKQLVLTFDDFLDSNIFSCMVYNYNEYQTYLESAGSLPEPSFLAYDEINIDTTIKKWMKFDDQTGLWVRKTNNEGDYTTLTDETGYHIYKIPTNILDENLYNKNELIWIASFARDSLIVPRIRLGNIIAKENSSRGWEWSENLLEGDEL